MTDVTLTETQCLYVRRLLFEELHEAAEILVEQTDAVVQDEVGYGALAEVDARGTWVNRLQVTAELLDAVGWSTQGITIVDLESARLRQQEGGE